MAFEHDETNPLDSSYIADFPLNERNHRTAVRDSVNLDHFAETTGYHRRATLTPLGSDPSTLSTEGFVYAKVISGKTELFYMDDTGQVIQLTDDGSASPDKMPLAGGAFTGAVTMTDADLLVEGTSLVKLLNAKYLQGRDVGDANWRDLVGIDASDVAEFGDVLLGGGLRLLADGVDEAVVEYGSGNKKLWHAGHFATAPSFIAAYESANQTITFVGSGAKFTLAHGLGAKPKLWLAVLVCIGAQEGYDIGDEIPVLAGLSVTAALTVAVDATNFYWYTTDGTPNVMKVDGTDTDIDETKWELVFRAWY